MRSTTAYGHPDAGKTPVRRWLADGLLPRMPESLMSRIRCSLMVATPRKVQRDGNRSHGLRYLALTMTAHVSEVVTLRYDHPETGRGGPAAHHARVDVARLLAQLNMTAAAAPSSQPGGPRRRPDPRAGAGRGPTAERATPGRRGACP